ncbi:MAG: hypothetical protein PHR14_08880, partial [Oscillospiraceae bacterium]|nr:hypothetical protein [Oscillospiraceae bacterium]
MKQRLGILIMMVLFLTSLISCGDSDEPSSKRTNTSRSTAGSATQDTTQSETADITATTDSSSDTSSPSPEATTSKGLTTIKPTTTIPKTEPSADGKFETQLLQYHPGLPEYDAEYAFVVKNDGLIVHISSITLKANDPRVRIKNGKVTVPYSVRKAGKDVVVTATYNSTGQSSKITIPSKTWEQTFN